MKIAISDVRGLLESMILEAMDEEPAAGCNIEFVEGQTLELHRAVRVIPMDGGGYFAGETSGARGRGTTAATLTPGTQCYVLKKIGKKEAWVEVDGLEGAIRIHINKFCPTMADQYLAGKKSGARATPPPMRGQVAPTGAPPKNRGSVEIQNEIDGLKQRYAQLKAELAAAQARETGVDTSDLG